MVCHAPAQCQKTRHGNSSFLEFRDKICPPNIPAQNLHLTTRKRHQHKLQSCTVHPGRASINQVREKRGSHAGRSILAFTALSNALGTPQKPFLPSYPCAKWKQYLEIEYVNSKSCKNRKIIIRN